MGRGFPIDLSGPERLAALAEEIDQARGSGDRFDLLVDVSPGADVRRWEAAGATWVLTSVAPQPPEHVVRDVIEAGP
jgi:hypothetical protein